MAIRNQEEKHDLVQQDEWTLTPHQMLFMIQHHNFIEMAFEQDNLENLREFAASDEFRALFNEMSFDEAYDRYESTRYSSAAY